MTAGAAPAEVDTLALLGRLGALDREQLLAFQYAKLLEDGDRVIDVGAHTGLHTSRFLRYVGPRGTVVAVEPLPDVTERFLAPLYQDHPRCQLVRGALADREGRAPFHVVTGSEQESGLLRRDAYAQPTRLAPVEVEVEVSTLDAIAAGRAVAFVKIDVEGAELRVLRGGRRTLASSRPVVALETSDAIRTYGDSLEDLYALVRALEYVIATVGGTVLSEEAFTSAARSGEMWDFFLLPAEQSAALCVALRAPDSPYLRDRCVDLRATSPGPHARGWVGFSALESWGRWTDARLASVAYVQLSRPVPDEVTLELTVMGARDRGTPFVIGLGDEERAAVAPRRLSILRVPFRGVGGGELLSLRPTRTVKAGDAADRRLLGVGVQSIRVLEGGGAARGW